MSLGPIRLQRQCALQADDRLFLVVQPLAYLRIVIKWGGVLGRKFHRLAESGRCFLIPILCLERQSQLAVNRGTLLVQLQSGFQLVQSLDVPS